MYYDVLFRLTDAVAAAVAANTDAVAAAVAVAAAGAVAAAKGVLATGAVPTIHLRFSEDSGEEDLCSINMRSPWRGLLSLGKALKKSTQCIVLVK